MKQSHGWGGSYVPRLVLALVLLCGVTVHAQKVFDVGTKILSDRQMNMLSANMPQAMALAPVAGKASAKVPLAGVDLATAGVILVNEKTGRRVVLSGLSSRCSEIVLTPLLVAELKQAVLGEADSYMCLVVEKLATDAPAVKRRCAVSAATDGVKCPVFKYGSKDNVKTTTLDERRLIRISQRAPMYHPSDGTPETLAEIGRLAEANKTYVYEYQLPDGAIYTYQPRIKPLPASETITVGDFTVVLTYAFSTDQKTAIQFVLQAWSDKLATSVPISLELGFGALEGSTLAEASTFFVNSDGRTYPCSVYNHSVGDDVFPGDPDFTITFNSDYTFSYATTGSTPADTTDFVSVFLHEVTHGLGFTDTLNSDGSYLFSGNPSKWEEYLYYNGSTLNTMTDSGRYTAIRSTALYWDGPDAKAANGGSRIKMYAPSIYALGSSVSHWDESVTFPTFMKFQVADGTNCREINDREAKLLKDVGWTLAAVPPAPTGVSAGDGVSTASVAVSWTASSGATGYDVYRHTSNSSASASLLASKISGTSYTDSTATPGVTFYYWVKAKNAAGSSAFSNYDTGFRLASIALGTALDGTGLTWTTGGDGSWFGQASTTYDGVDAAQSGDVNDSQTSWLETTVSGPGTMSFKWNVSSEQNRDKLHFMVDGTSVTNISGSSGWLSYSAVLTSGTHAVTWSYEKDSSLDEGGDCGWVDQVVWTPSTTTDVPVPYTWLDSYLVVSGGNYEAAARADADGDGHLTWQEYVAGTNPTNGTSVFKAGINISNGVRTLTWTPNLGAERTYTIEGKAVLTDSFWASPTNAASRFFRVKVAFP